MHVGRTLVIGIGNQLRGDDGIGPAVVARLRAALPDVAAIETLHDPLALLDAWGDADTVVVVDAVESGAVPGTLHRFEAHAAPLPARCFGRSTHAIGLAATIELGRALGRLPARLIVLGIEAERFGIGQCLSRPLDAALEAAVVMLLREVHSEHGGMGPV